MNYPIIDDYKYDINQLFKENIIPNELRVIEDGINAIVPKNAPFFVNSLELKTIEGNDLVLGQDYRIFRLMSKLTGLAATPIACLIEILNPAVKSVFMKYHTVGNTSLFDSSLIELVNNAANDQRLIKYKNLLNKPVVFTPTAHKHSLIYDMVVWEDAIDTFTRWLELLTNTDTNYVVTALTAYCGVIQAYIDHNSAMLLSNLAAHTATYNEHGLTSTQVNLNKVENLKTATLREVLQGRSDRHYTTDNLLELIKKYGYNTDNLLESNLLPISFYGNTNFIPPGIGGSFEGLGSESELMIMCPEIDGTISCLSNHFDGRTNGLYFSILSDYDTTPKVSYQSYRYNHPVLTTAGIVPTMLFQSEGKEIFLMGDGNRWFIGLTNGTLNPDKHTLTEIDLSAFNATYLDGKYCSIHLMGSYVVIIQSTPGGTYNIGTNVKTFYRLPTSALIGSGIVTPTVLNLSYTNADGTSFTNAPTFLWADATKDANGLFTRAYLRFNPPLDVGSGSINAFYRTTTHMSTPSSKAGVWVLHFMAHAVYTINNSQGAWALGNDPEDVYEFNPITGLMTQLDYLVPPTLDANSAAAGGAALLKSYYSPTARNWTASGTDKNGFALLDNGNFLMSYTGGASATPHQIGIIKSGAVDKLGSINHRWSTPNYPSWTFKGISEVIQSPIANSIFGNSLTYDANGEFFNSVGKSSNSGFSTFYRVVTGDYAVRDTFTNTDITGLNSRPLSNVIYPTNIPSLQPRVNITGDAAAITALGLTGLGQTSFSVGIQGKYWVTNAAGWSVPPKDNSIVMAKETTQSLVGGVMTVVPTGYITYPVAIVNAIAAAIIPTAYQNTPSFTAVIVDLSFVNNALITNRPVLVQVHYVDLATNIKRCAVATLSVTYSTSGNNSTVTAFTVLSMNDVADHNAQINVTPTAWPITYVQGLASENAINLYYTGTNINLVFNTYLRSNYTGYSSYNGSRWVVGQTDNLIKSINAYFQGIYGGSNLVYVPKLGLGTKYDSVTSGGCADIVKISSTVNVGRISCYPDPAWSVFFQTTVNAIFNSKTFIIPTGVIDLRTVNASPGNQTFYIYARLVNGTAGYVIESAKTFDSIYNIWIGTITTNASQILSIERNNAFLLNGARISRNKVGGAIPATTGDISANGQLYWIYPDEIIQS